MDAQCLGSRHLSTAGRWGVLAGTPSGLSAAIAALFTRESTPPRPSLFAGLVLARCASCDGGAHMSHFSYQVVKVRAYDPWVARGVRGKRAPQVTVSLARANAKVSSLPRPPHLRNYYTPSLGSR